ncbi:MAG: ABC transporter permease subunit [Clostridiales bacterium]|nr:ABC transporter permease subunit [Clostridiales bacterium]
MLRGSAVLRGTGYSFKTYIKRYWTLYLLLLVPIAFFAIFRYYPMSYISLAFKQNNILMHPWKLPLAEEGGLEWFMNAFKDNAFGRALFNTVFLNLLDLCIGMPMPIIMALLLNELAFPKYKRLTQTVLYLPHFLSWVIISHIALRLFGTNDGIINKLFNTTVPYMSENNHWRIMYIVLGIWKECGWNTIIYLAALTGINAELYEAAEVDGAGRLQKIWHVTLPGIRSTIIVLLIMNLGRILGSEFDRPYTLANKMVNQVSTTISIFVYERGLQGNQYSLSTAVGLFQSIVCVIFLVASNTLAKKFGERGIW